MWAKPGGHALDLGEILGVVVHLHQRGFDATVFQIHLHIVCPRAFAVIAHQVNIAGLVSWGVQADFFQHAACLQLMLLRIKTVPAAVTEHEGQLVEIIKNTRLAFRFVIIVAIDPDQAGLVELVNLEGNRNQLARAHGHQ